MDVPLLQVPGRLMPRSRPLRSTSNSPTRQRTTDDLLAHLSPRTAVAAFQNPSGTLKACIDASTIAEQSFAIRTALASQHIYEWLEELATWPWSTGDVAAAFEASQPEKNRSPAPGSVGSEEFTSTALTPTRRERFSKAELHRYQTRINEIARDLEALKLDEIKAHVLYHRIMPLSRPGTPMSDAGFAGSHSLSYTKLDDLTALITATILQALPNLSKLNRHMHIWSMRFIVCKTTPVFLSALHDAESALHAATEALVPSGKDGDDSPRTDRVSQLDLSTFSRQDFETLKSIVDIKISRAGRHMDVMLDAFEGSNDTLPDHWIDQLESVERRYGEWVVTAETNMQKAIWADKERKEAASKDIVGLLDSPMARAEKSANKDTAYTGENPRKYPALQSPPSIEFDKVDDDDSEPELPPLPRPRRDSDVSMASTLAYGSDLGDVAFSSDPADHGSPDIARHYHVETETVPSRDPSPDTSPPDFRSSVRSASFNYHDMPTVEEMPDDESSFNVSGMSLEGPIKGKEHDQLQEQISNILQGVPARIRLASEPPAINLNPPDFKMPTAAPRTRPPKPDRGLRSHSSLSTMSAMSSRAGTPSFLLAPAQGRSSRMRNRGNPGEIKMYHLSRSDGEAPIKLLIRCVGENGERVMVRVGGGWADLGEYLKEYASHHGRRSGGDGKVEVKDLPRMPGPRVPSGSSPPSRPGSALEHPSTPLQVRKTRKSTVDDVSLKLPRTPLAALAMNQNETPLSELSTRSRSSSRLSWTEEESSLGMAGPWAKQVDMTEESKAWVESVKEKVRIASSERKMPELAPSASFGELGKVGGTRRVFKRPT